MKKSLLIAAAALFVAIGANAQNKYLAQPTKGMAASTNITLEKASNVFVSPVQKSATNKTSRRAGEIDGAYIMNFQNMDKDFTGSSEVTLISQEGTITLDQYDGEPTFNYNVVLNDFTYAGAVAYGYLDAETNTIEIPVQTIINHAQYGRIVFSALICDATGEPLSYGYEMVLDVNEDGSLSVNPGDFSGEAGMEGAYTSGWYSFLPDYEKTSSGGYYSWNSGLEIEFFVPNATMYYTTTGKSLGGNGSWTKVQKRVYVDDYGTELVVNGFLGVAPVSVIVNGDGTCKIPFGQELDDYDYEDPYGRIHLVGCLIDGNSIGRDPSKEYLNGFVSTDNSGAKVYEFYKTEYKEAWEDEDGKHDAGYYFIDDDPDYCRYYAAASNNDADGAAYMMGWCCNTWIECDAEPAGISNVKTNAKNTVKTYNLMGQEVNANAKGLIIRDGKKLINK